MTKENPQSVPPSEKLLEMIFGFALSRAISVAAQFGVADLVKAGPRTADEVAQKIGAHPRSLYRMLRALAGAGIFAEDAAGRFSLTPLAEPLCSDAPQSLRAFVTMMANEVNFKTWAQLPYSIQTGQPAFPHYFGMPWFAYLEKDRPEAQVFNDAMTSLSASAVQAVVSAYDFSGISKLVDVGGGHGLLLASVLSKYPRMKGVLFDAPSVVAGAPAVLTAHGVANRCETVGGDFFQMAPAGGDGYIMKHIIHDWSDEDCLKILGHCHAGMTAGGKLLIVEMVLPERNVPAVSKLLDLQMLLFLTGRERTATEYRALLASAGFEMTRIVPTPATWSVIESVKKYEPRHAETSHA